MRNTITVLSVTLVLYQLLSCGRLNLEDTPGEMEKLEGVSAELNEEDLQSYDESNNETNTSRSFETAETIIQEEPQPPIVEPQSTAEPPTPLEPPTAEPPTPPVQPPIDNNLLSFITVDNNFTEEEKLTLVNMSKKYKSLKFGKKYSIYKKFFGGDSLEDLTKYLKKRIKYYIRFDEAELKKYYGDMWTRVGSTYEISWLGTIYGVRVSPITISQLPIT